MSNNKDKKQSHRDIAMEFLLAANRQSETPISEDIITEVYTLFAEAQSESATYQRSLELLINS